MFTVTTATMMLMLSVVPIAKDGLTIDQAVTAACSNRAEVLQADLSERSARASLLSSTLWFTPSISASAALNGMETEVPEVENYSSSLSLNANMNLFSLQSIGNRRVSSVSLDITEESVRASRAAVMFDAASAWYSVLQTETVLELAELNLSTQEEMFRLVGAKYDAGLVSRYEYLAGHVSLENVRPVYTAAVSSMENVMGELSLATGLPNCNTMQISGSLADALPVYVPDNPAELGNLAVRNSSTAVMAGLLLESAEAQTFTARAGYAPTLNLNGSISWGNSSDDIDDLGERDLTRTTSAGVSVNVPIFTSFANETAVKTARYSELSAQYELEQVQDEVRQSALEAWNNYFSSEQRLLGADALVMEAEEALNIAEITYQAGSITRIEVEQSILGLMTARESRAEALLAMRMAELNIAMLTGEIHEIWEVE